MRLKINKDDDALYFRLDEAAIVDSQEVQPGIILDFDKNGKVIGVEILDISTRANPDQLRILQFETV